MPARDWRVIAHLDTADKLPQRERFDHAIIRVRLETSDAIGKVALGSTKSAEERAFVRHAEVRRIADLAVFDAVDAIDRAARFAIEGVRPRGRVVRVFHVCLRQVVYSD